MRDLLEQYFGHSSFLPMQEEIISNVMNGEDALVVMPTGGGKSLCYQLPALQLDGLTLVVSPLIALMQDQVEFLQRNGISAAFINSSQTSAESQRVQEKAQQGKLKMLYVAPERLASLSFWNFLNRLRIGLIAVDEAHCISTWGHDFRPEYRKLGQLRKGFSSVPILALTATATEKVRYDIITQLQLSLCQQYVASFNRPNLSYSVIQKRSENFDFQRLIGLLKEYKGDSTIIYRSKRRTVEKLAWSLRQRGFEALPYHAGLEYEIRSATQTSFMTGKVPIIVATTAFGMGIDKPDIRLLVHYDLPSSLEGYYQETGRAGRDGESSDCVLFFSRSDRATPDYFIRRMRYQSNRHSAKLKLEQVLNYGELNGCRRKFLLHYFNEPWKNLNCGNCDNCLKHRRTPSPSQIPMTHDGFSGDFAVLLGLKKSLAGKYLLNWEEQVGIHEWEGVTFDPSTQPPTVTELRLEGMGLSGVIPQQMGSLSALKVLNLMENWLKGPIPPELGNLPSLKELYLMENDLSGAIPFQLGNLKELETLFLSSNKLSGSIPAELGNLGKLEDLLLGDNDLIGEIPPEFGKLKNLKALLLDGNRLQGSIPPEMGNLTRLETLILEDNKLSGPIPALLENLSNLEMIRIRDNNFSGCIPDTWQKASDTDLDKLGLPFCGRPDKVSEKTAMAGDFKLLLENKCVLEGRGSLNWSESVSVEEWDGIRISSSTPALRVTEIRLDCRGLTGSIPAELGRLAKLEVLSLEENRLEGSIPSELGKLANLKRLSLEENELSGSIPPELGNLTKLKGLTLYDNNLVGPIPPDLGNIRELDALFLDDNNLSGPIPPELGNLTNLSILILGDNKLRGRIPSELGNLKNLEALFLEENKLSGPIPSELGNLTKLNALLLNDNRLSGLIPSELCNLTGLDTLRLNDNMLSGKIPSELGNLTKLEAVYVGENDLNGTVPDTWLSIREHDFSL